MSTNILIGTDPEVFLKKDGKNISAHGIIPGDKHDPYRLTHGFIQLDGTAAEFNTDPAATADEFVANIESVMSEMFQFLSSDVTVAIEPTAYYDEEYFASLPDDVKMLGCQPDFNAYTEDMNTPPNPEVTFRTGAGHIHVGFSEAFDPFGKEHFLNCCALTKQLDATLYMSSLLWDFDKNRRELYGKIGAFRPKYYGVEYRSISNAYLRTKEIQRFVFEISMDATKKFLNGVVFHDEPFVAELLGAIHEDYDPSDKEVREFLRKMNSTFAIPLMI